MNVAAYCNGLPKLQNENFLRGIEWWIRLLAKPDLVATFAKFSQIKAKDLTGAIHNFFFNAHFQSPTHRLNMAKIENSISQMKQVEAR